MRKPDVQRQMPSGTCEESVISRLCDAVQRFFVSAFPDREILLRADGRVRFFRVSSAAQIFCAAVMLLLLPAVLYNTGHDLLFPDSVVAQKSQEVGKLKSAYSQLQSENADAQARYRLITRQLEAKHAYLLSVLQQNNALHADIGQMRGQVDLSAAERQEIAVARGKMRLELSQLESSLKNISSERETLASRLKAKETELSEVMMERSRALRDRGRLQAHSEELQNRLASLQHGQQEVLERLSARTAGSIGEIKSLIARTGLDPERLLSDGTASGLGGPFVEIQEEQRSDLQIAALNNHIDQWDELQQVLRRLPFSAPVDNYVKMSPFGRRQDPINGKLAMHNGVDFAASPKAPILSAAPGVVAFVGTNGSYGRMVEIDHGMGIRTRYGHLSSTSVRKGQTVGYRQPIGVIGSSGRSTGLHLHYEVLVKDKPYDPMRFIEAGKDVFKG